MKKISQAEYEKLIKAIDAAYRRAVQPCYTERMIDSGVTAGYRTYTGRSVVVQGKVNWSLSMASIRKFHAMLERIVRALDEEDSAYRKLNEQYEIADEN